MRRKGLAVAGVVAVAATVLMAPPARAAATLTVDRFEDSFDGTCADDDCSLRDALASVDADGTVRLPSGFYQLSVAGSGGIEAGDLDVERPVTIATLGETGAFLDASTLGDRVFDLRARTSLVRLALLGGSPVGTGGLVRVGAGSARMESVTLIGGSAVDGGAVAVGEGGAARIVRSWISAGTAAEHGGALFVRGRATVVRSTLSDNHAGGGGGIWVGPGGSLDVTDTTISGNVAERAGGGVNTRGQATIRSATVARNRAAVAGAVRASAAADVTVTSSVFWGNDATDRGTACSRPLASGGHNVSDALGCGLDGPGDLVGVDPQVGPLRQNGGPTPTHALRAGSPAVGNGGTACSAFDQRGAPRRDCDSGSYELVFCLGRPVTIVGTAGADDLSGGLERDVFLGRAGDDVFQGSVAEDRACGGRGDDRLIGGPDDDRLAGEHGDDALIGEAGADLLLGGSGTDVCRGGDGSDEARRCERVISAV